MKQTSRLFGLQDRGLRSQEKLYSNRTECVKVERGFNILTSFTNEDAGVQGGEVTYVKS